MADDIRFDESGIRVGGQRPPLKHPIYLSDNSRTVLTKRYLRRGPDGNPVETEEELFWRVAWNVAMPENDHGEHQQAVAEEFYHMLTAKRFFPNSPTFTGAGTPLGQLAACFVLKIEDDMGRTGEGIFETLRNAALIQQTGGGNGFAFSGLRPAGAIVKSSNGQATGPIGFLRVYDQAFGEIAQGGCLTPDTLVHTAEGTLRLDEIVSHDEPGWQSHDVMVATDEGPRHSAEAYNNGVVPVLRITTSEGIQITGTPNHKFKVMTVDGPIWKQAQELEPGDALMVQLGQHQGVMQHTLALAGADSHPVEFTAQMAYDAAFYRNGSMPLESEGVPSIVRCSPVEVVEAYIEGFRAASIDRNTITFMSEETAREFTTMLIGVGYKAQISYDKSAWFVSIGDKAEGKWFITVEAVEEAGEALTLDMEVADNHTYIANGIVTHNSRRGANMGVLRVDHPDIREFVTCKTSEEAITNFNISVGITDEFMQAVRDDGTFDLIDPNSGDVWETVRARDLFEEIITHAHNNGEPGMLFLDAANRDNPVPHLYDLEATNPCVPGDTLVSTPDGWRRADEIAVGDEICTVLGTGQVATIERHEDMPVYAVHLSDGEVVRATASHQFHARDSRTNFFEPRRLDELEEGMWVRVFRGRVPDNPVPKSTADHLTDHEYGFLVGALVGDGMYTPKQLERNVVRISSHADEEEWNELLIREFSKVGVERVSTYGYENSRSLTMDPKPGRVIADWVKSTPLTPARSHEKTLPDEFINSNREFLTGLIDGLFSTDGSVDLSSNHPLVRFHTASKTLAKQVRRILLMFGIHARIHKTIRKRHDIDGRVIRHDRPKYDVIASGSSFGRFFEQFTLSHPDKQYRMEEAALMCNFTGGNWAAKVKKIEPAGTATVYDIYEPKSDTWITEGYVSRGCGEQWLGPFENCCLGSVNLAMHVTDEGEVDWEALRETVELATRFLDDVVDANAYVPEIPQLRAAAERVRRIGLGIMGLADMMYALGVRYGSEEGQEFAAQVMEFIHYHSMATSVRLAEKRGAFLAIRGSMYDPDNLTWQPPAPLNAYTRDWGRPTPDWDAVVAGIKQHGIRNGAQTTIAPTGTISTVAGVEGYGCEPVFALAYTRYFDDNGERKQLQYTSPLFEQALIEAGVDEATRDAIVQEVMRTGTVQNIDAVPEEVRRVFVVSSDITAKEHVRMQAAMQRFVSNAISKTCNFPGTATEEDVAEAFQLAWELGCKGLTVYVAGSREKVVLETKETKEQRGEGADEAPVAAVAPKVEAPAVEEPQQRLFPPEAKKPRSRVLNGFTYRVQTPVGTAFITINENGGNQPFEVFINTAKAGSETAAVSEAMGRLISYILRIRSDVPPRERLVEVVRQLEGIGGMRPLGLGPNRVRSLPDGVAQMLDEYIENADEVAARTASENRSEATYEPPVKPVNGQLRMNIGDLCPECGEAGVINEEGCRKCYGCGYSEC